MFFRNRFIVFLILMCTEGSEGFSYGRFGFRTSNALTTNQVNRLNGVYGLTQATFGSFLQSQIWQSEEKGNNGKPLASGFLLVLNNGICGGWTVWKNHDRFYHWHEGRAIIDTISPAGVRVSTCLGSTATDASCRYVVKIPRGWFAAIRTVGDLAVFTGVPINGDLEDGENKSLHFMFRNFGQQHGDLIRQTVRCYRG